VPTFSAFWVGIGGLSASSRALEQIGTEADCTTSGRERSIAWLELVPAPSRTIRMTVRPGDRISASVTVSGHRVRLRIADRTRGSAFARTLTAPRVDTGSAEWIAEAPSLCTASSCQIAPLADFGTVTFSHASAQNRSGHSGSITDRRWSATAISLVDTTRFGPGPSAGAEPSKTSLGGTRFKVRYRSAGAVASSSRAVRRYPG
jgi:hypothetical protein